MVKLIPMPSMSVVLSCPPGGPATANESLFSNSRHGENFVFDFRVRSPRSGRLEGPPQADRPRGHPSRRPREERGLLVRKSKTKFSPCRELENRLSFAVVGPAGGQLRMRSEVLISIVRYAWL